MPRHFAPPRQRQFARQLRSAQTLLEAGLWRALRAKRLDGWKFKRQVPIGPYIVDFVCFERRVIVEADGPVHAVPEQQLHDLRRDAYLRDAGFRVLRFSEGALGDSAKVMADIRQTGAAPSPDP